MQKDSIRSLDVPLNKKCAEKFQPQNLSLANLFRLSIFVKTIFLGFIFPSDCLICKDPLNCSNSGLVCQSCLLNLPFIQGPICYKCGSPIQAAIGNIPAEKLCCSDCQNKNSSFQARSVFYYEGIIRQLIHHFKFHGKVTIGKTLAKQFIDYQKKEPDFFSTHCIIPVPLGIKKLRQREFNQSYILAKVIGKYLTIPVYPFILKKIKEITPQMKLSRKERIQNIRGAFTVCKKKLIEGKDILLIDDVYTTGATIAECSKLLFQNGAGRVHALTLARSIL